MRSPGAGPPSQWPTARPAIVNNAIAARVPWPISPTTERHDPSTTGRNEIASSSVPIIPTGLAARAEEGATRAMIAPSTSGISTEAPIVLAITATGTSTVRPAMRPMIAIVTGTVTSDTTADKAGRPTAYDLLAPALACLFGSTGGTGETASTISASLTSGRSWNAAAAAAASSGMMTFIASSERTMSLGRRTT